MESRETLKFYETLIKKYKDQSATDEELAVFFNLISEGKIDESLLQDMSTSFDDHNGVSSLQKEKKTGKTFHFLKYAAAVIVLFITSYSLYYFFLRADQMRTGENMSGHQATDISAGTNKATLRLADGTTILLDSAHIGQIVQHEGIKVQQTDDGTLVFDVSTIRESGHSDRHVRYHEIYAPRGGQYKIVLPDGSRVWLNADSKLRFPEVFAVDRRDVILEGEAYFDVTKNQKPFTVHTDGQRVQVLGTQFNVRAYKEDRMCMTTLVSGKVNVHIGDHGSSQRIILNPSEQALYDLDTHSLSMTPVDVNGYIAWKEGLFIFENTDLVDVMKEISRWYDVDVDVESIPAKKLYATLPKSVPLSELLGMIEMTSKVKFKVQGRRISL